MSEKLVRFFSWDRIYLKSARVAVFSALIFLSSGCVTQPPKEDQWPKEMPSRDYFVASYYSDQENQASGQTLDEYLLWVVRFYQGWELYRNGWNRVTDDAALAEKDPQKSARVKTEMQVAGRIIAGEWAKNKKTRRVLTRHVAVWGNALLESIRRDKELELIYRVQSDATALVQNQLDINSVKAERYFPADKDDAFNQ